MSTRKKTSIICLAAMALLFTAHLTAKKKKTPQLKDLSKSATYVVKPEGKPKYNVNKAFLLKEGKRKGKYKNDFAFHSGGGKDAHILITLKKAGQIKKVIIENRRSYRSRAKGLTVWVSLDKKKWTKVWQAKKVEKKWTVNLKAPVKAKYVKIGLIGDKRILHLNKVRIYGK